MGAELIRRPCVQCQSWLFAHVTQGAKKRVLVGDRCLAGTQRESLVHTTVHSHIVATLGHHFLATIS